MPVMSVTPAEGNDSKKQEWFIRLYQTYKDEMFHIANVVLENETDAEDVVQLAFIKLLGYKGIVRKLHSESMRDIALVITMGIAVEYCREREKHCYLSWEELACTMESGAESSADRESTRLNVAMSLLPDNYRKVLILRYYCGFTTQEIAQSLSLNQRQVRRMVQRARELLKEYLEKEEMEL